jgi:Nif-specific regulatory protein
LTGCEVAIGRDAANALCLADPALSRRHCVLTRDAEGWSVRDLGSSNGTFVNGIQVMHRPLATGDRLGVGESVLLFVDAEATPHVDLVHDEGAVPTVTIGVDAPNYVDSPSSESPASRVEHGLRALLKVSTAVSAMRSETDLFRELLLLTREAVPFQYGVVVLVSANSDAAVVETVGDAEERIRVSRGVVDRVLEQRAGILSRDVSRGVEPDAIVSEGVRTLLCVPMAMERRPPGAIYLVSDERTAFNEDDLQLVLAIARIATLAVDNVRYLAEVQQEAARVHADIDRSHNLVGDSEAIRRVYERIARVARGDATVLITGETGTGKELAARAIHRNSARAQRPFITVNCAALAESLLESELFGHERGAFTGAIAQKKGKFEVADGGSVFLDEVGELALVLQSKLLRVLQEREFERVGGVRPIKSDIRVIAATNRNLPAEVRAGRFREDLYFRLNVVSVRMPPLRERRSDIPALVRHALSRCVRKTRRRISGVSDDAMACLSKYDWPGNVRELENAIERAATLGVTEEILREDLPEDITESFESADNGAAIHSAVTETKKRAIVDAFRRAGGSYIETARLLGIHPNYLHRLIRNLGLKPLLTRTL